MGHDEVTQPVMPGTVDSALTEGDGFGRFVIVEELGRGGMGRVMLARDPQLDRLVALKLLRRASTPRGEARMLREARALAQLAHPHIVAVFDVGRIRATSYIAMEYVAGVDLRDWLARGQPWPQVLEVFVEAGRGLLAAHQAGLVHRDFKPSNVLVEEDAGRRGRARVMDFGLARGSDSVEGTAVVTDRGRRTTESLAEALGGEALGADLTKDGVILGTPAYMAPEQHVGARADARSDQYAFCIALWEGLYARRPFVERSAEMLIRAKAAGRVGRPSVRGVPRHVHRALVRGLSPDPDRRFDSMRELLAAIDPERGRRRRWPTAVAATGATVALGVVTWPSTPLCETAAERVDEVWGSAQRGEVREALLDTDLAYAESTWQRVEERLDEYAGQWHDARTDACQRATEPEDAALVDAEIHCLDERLGGLEGLVGTLADADESVVARAVYAAVKLPAIEQCTDPAYLRARVPPPDARLASAVKSVREKLARVWAMSSTGRVTVAFELAELAQVEADGVDYEPVQVEAGLVRGVMMTRAGRYDAALAVLSETYFSAQLLGMEEVQVNAATALLRLTGVDMMRPDEALQWAERAEQHVEARDRATERGRYLVNLGATHWKRGALDEAQAVLEQALVVRAASLGPQATETATVLVDLGGVARARGDLERAHESFVGAREILEEALGPNHPRTAIPYNNLAAIAVDREQWDEARSLHERALAIRRGSYGERHPEVAASLTNLAAVLTELGETETALDYSRRAVDIFEATVDPSHPNLAMARHNLAVRLQDAGDSRGALRHYEGSLGAFEVHFGPDHPYVANTLDSIASMHVELDDPASALPLLERALKIVEAAQVPERERIAARYHLGRTMVEAQRDVEHGMALVRAAIDGTPPGADDLRTEMTSWLEDAAAPTL